MDWKEQLRKSDEIEKNFMQTLSNVADKVMPGRVDDRKLQAYNNAEMNRSRAISPSSSEHRQLSQQQFEQWVNSNPQSFPNGKSTEGKRFNIQSKVDRVQWDKNGGQQKVTQQLEQKYPKPRREDFMKQEETKPQFVDPENQEEMDKALVGGQKELDKDKDGDIDEKDLRQLREEKK